MADNAGPCCWAARVKDMDAEVKRLQAAGVAVSAPERSGRARPDGKRLDWETAQLGAEPREALLVGDSEVDVQTARNAGTLAAAVNYGFGVHDRKTYPADIYLERFGDLVTLLDGGSISGCGSCVIRRARGLR